MSLHDAKKQLQENIKLLHPTVNAQTNLEHMVLYNLSNALVNIVKELEIQSDNINKIGVATYDLLKKK